MRARWRARFDKHGTAKFRPGHATVSAALTRGGRRAARGRRPAQVKNSPACEAQIGARRSGPVRNPRCPPIRRRTGARS